MAKRRATAPPPAPDVRVELVQVMQATLADEAAHGDWTYEAVRPMPVPASWKPGQRVTGDCSKGVQYLCRWSPGAPDPMDNGWADWGNSSTLCAHLQHLLSASMLLPGDVVTFGVNGDEHAAMVLEAGADPLLWSFGHQGAPNTYRLSQDGRAAQYLRLPVPAYVPSADEKLRGETGYWAWMQWKLGEGDWKHKQPADPAVRPDVRVTIPLKWWFARARYLKNRRQGNPPSAATPHA